MKGTKIVLMIAFLLTAIITVSSAETPDTDNPQAAACSLESLTGKYATYYGKMDCSIQGEGLHCCYYFSSYCRHYLKFDKVPGQAKLSGEWFKYGKTGPAEFPLGEDCSIESGKWGDTDLSKDWPVTKRISSELPSFESEL